MSAPHRSILLRAAELIEGAARELRRGHTLGPRHSQWPVGEAPVRLEHDDMVRTARELRRIAG